MWKPIFNVRVLTPLVRNTRARTQFIGVEMFEISTQVKFPKCFVVVGTDTEVGKTVISTLLLSLLHGTYWKPIQSGMEPETDTHFVKTHSFLPESHLLREYVILSKPLAPSQAAPFDNKEIKVSDIKIPPYTYHPLIIEGAGGIMTPLNDNELYIDLLKSWGLPVLLVARSTLGTINHTLLSLKALSDYGIEVLGVVLNGPKNPLNKKSIEKHGKVSVIAEMTPVDDLKEVCQTLYAEKL